MSKKQTAFTLAEVLITLGIIGVVAALTIPTLIKGYEKIALQTAFKKSYSTLLQGIKKTAYDTEYPACTYLKNGGYVDSGCNDFHNLLLENLKYLKECKGNSFSNHCIADIKGFDTITMAGNPNLTLEDARNQLRGVPQLREQEIKNINISYILADGSTLMIYTMPDSHTHPIYLVDTNGLKGPNKWGYDIFTYVVSNYELHCIYDVVEKGGESCTSRLKRK